MSQDRDPFELLPRFTDPEPDPVIMKATIARASEAFARRPQRQHPAGLGSWTSWFSRPAGWLVPAGAGVFALVVAVMVAPGLLRMPDPVSADQERLAEAPAAAAPMPSEPPILSRGGETAIAEAPSVDSGVRMGMQSYSGQPPAAPPPQLVSVFQGDDVRIGTRLSATALDIYLPDLSGETTVDIQGLIPGEQIELLAAFQLPERDIVAVRMRVDDTRFWRIYRPVDGQYARDMELSRLVLDAADRAEVESRLAGS